MFEYEIKCGGLKSETNKIKQIQIMAALLQDPDPPPVSNTVTALEVYSGL